jgi:hypothetical protein
MRNRMCLHAMQHLNKSVCLLVQRYLLTGTKVLQIICTCVIACVYMRCNTFIIVFAYWYKRTTNLCFTGTKILAYWYKSTANYMYMRNHMCLHAMQHLQNIILFFVFMPSLYVYTSNNEGYIQTYIHVCVCVFVCVCVCVEREKDIYIYTYTYIHMYIYIYPRMEKVSRKSHHDKFCFTTSERRFWKIGDALFRISSMTN